jgi:hypothetical protein
MIDGVVTQHGNPLLLSPKRVPTIHTDLSLAASSGRVQTQTTGS